MRRKGVIPYDYLDSFEKFKDTQLPVIDSFTILSGKKIVV